MSAIFLKNTTGRLSGRFMRYEYGQDLFGYIYLDVVSGKKHRAKRLRSLIFQTQQDFLHTLDIDLYHKENLDYVPQS